MKTSMDIFYKSTICYNYLGLSKAQKNAFINNKIQFLLSLLFLKKSAVPLD